MKPSEIIKQEAQKIGYNADEMLGKISKLVNSKAGILLQKNDSLLLIIGIAKGVAEVHIFTVDRPAKIAESLKYFIEKVKGSGLKKIYGSENEDQANRLKQTLALLTRLGVPVQKSNWNRYSWMASI